MLVSFKLEGQYRFDFEIDTAGCADCCPGDPWRQEPGMRWCCDATVPLEGAVSLRHCYDNPEEGCDYLVLPCDALRTDEPFSFSFRIRHGFDPSSLNNWQLALGANFGEGSSSGGEGPHIISGLVLGVNYTGSDDLLKIWHVDGVKCVVLCASTLNYQEDIGTAKAPCFKLEGKGDGNLDLYWSPDPQEQAPVYLASCRIDEYTWDRQVVVRYRYTSSRDRALWLDQVLFEGHFERDSLAPRVSRLDPVGSHALELTFSEQVVLSDACRFTLFKEGSEAGMAPDSLGAKDKGFLLYFREEIANRVPCGLRVEGVADPDGNVLRDTLVQVIRNEARWGDVVFNEVMADPDPPLQYREEYLELYNRSGFPLDLSGWKLMVNERNYLLENPGLQGSSWLLENPGLQGSSGLLENPVLQGSSGLQLSGGNFLVITDLTLPNEGGLLSLYSAEGTLIHAASYRIPWDGPGWKKEGGWSLESPDAEQPCRISYLWEYSGDPGGGTPGRINSNRGPLVDMKAPVLLYAGVSAPGGEDLYAYDAGDGEGDVAASAAGRGALFLHYSESLRLPQDPGATIRLDPGGTFPDSVHLLDPLQEVVQLDFPVDLLNRTRYQLILPGFCDCAGNYRDGQVLTAGAPGRPVSGSVLINEIMYDPDEGKPGFVELYLPGEQIIDLKDLAIHLVEEGGIPDHPLALSPHSRLFLPGQYLVLSECVAQLEEAYGLETSGQWVELSGLSGLKASSGVIYLTDRAGQVVDVAVYREEMHLELLDDPRGISLERVTAERPGNDPDNWHSATSISGYSTPGKENSQAAGGSDSDRLLELSTEVFSPDNDGYLDLLEIYIRTGGNDWVVSMLITDLQGRPVRILANNHLAAPFLTYSWDGEGENGMMQPMGFYVIHARGYSPVTGQQWVRRKAVGLVYR